MKTFFFCLLTIFASIHAYAASFNQSSRLSSNDSSIKVLKITNLKNQKVHYIFPGTQVTYWHIAYAHEFKHAGILEGFSGDSLLIAGKTKPLTNITRVKKTSNPGIPFLKGLLGFGAFVLAGFGIIGGAVLIEQNLWDPSIPMGFIAIILGAGAAWGGVRLWKGLGKGLGKGHNKYQMEIVEFPE